MIYTKWRSKKSHSAEKMIPKPCHSTSSWCLGGEEIPPSFTTLFFKVTDLHQTVGFACIYWPSIQDGAAK
jgi:hypothetical protein